MRRYRLVNQYAAFLDEALGEEESARAVYDEAIAAAPGNPLVWEGAVHFERHRAGSPGGERLRKDPKPYNLILKP